MPPSFSDLRCFQADFCLLLLLHSTKTLWNCPDIRNIVSNTCNRTSGSHFCRKRICTNFHLSIIAYHTCTHSNAWLKTEWKHSFFLMFALVPFLLLLPCFREEGARKGGGLLCGGGKTKMNHKTFLFDQVKWWSNTQLNLSKAIDITPIKNWLYKAILLYSGSKSPACCFTFYSERNDVFHSR